MLETWNIVSCPYSMYVYTLCTKFASLGQFLSSLHVYQSRKNLASDRSTCWPIRALHSSGGLQVHIITPPPWIITPFEEPDYCHGNFVSHHWATRPPATKNRYSTLNWRVSKIAHICILTDHPFGSFMLSIKCLKIIVSHKLYSLRKVHVRMHES